MTQSTSYELQPLVEQCSYTLLSCFPPEMHDAELFKTLCLQFLQQVLATEQDASSHPYAAMQAPDLTTLMHAVQQLPRAAAREVSSHIASSRMDLTTINNGYLTMATAKWLKSTISPLSLSEVIPSLWSLNSWWPKVVRALSQIYESVMPEYLSKLAIQTLAPYILGDAAWQIVAQKFEQSSVADWDSFCSIVESDFRGSKTLQRLQFLLFVPLPNEIAAAFIKRMEVSRAQLQCEGKNCVVALCNKLPATFQHKIEQVCLSQALYGQEELTWELIVLIAKDKLSGAGVADLTPLPTFPAPSASAPRAVTARQPQATRSSSLQAPHVRVLPRPQCPLYSQIGVVKAFHNLDGCYLNPRGQSFCQAAYDRKVAYLIRNNIALPQAIKMPLPPFATPSLPFHPTTPAKSVMNASFDNFDAFEKYICSIGLSDSTIQGCLAVYQEHNTPCKGQHMIMDLGDDVYLPMQIGAGAKPEQQATYMDQLLMSQKDARQQQRNQTYSDLVAAMQRVTQRLEQIAAGKPIEADGSIPLEDDDDVPLAQVQRQLQQVQCCLANASVQTGGVGGRRIKLGREGNLKVSLQLDYKKIAERIELSMPLLHATITDSTLRELILCQFISLNIKEGKAVVIPDGTIINQVNQATFDTYRTELEGVSASNIGDVTAPLSQMGLDGRGNVQLGNVLLAVASQQSFMLDPQTALPADKLAINSTVAQFSKLTSTLESLLCPTANSSDQAVPLQGNFLAAASQPF